MRPDAQNRPRFVAQNEGQQEQSYSPEEVSAYIMKHIQRFASERVQEEAKYLVITVPANFD